MTLSFLSFMKKSFKIFVLSDSKDQSHKLMSFLSGYENYELHFISTAMNLFDVYELEPDIVVLDNSFENIVNCYEWGEVA